VAGESERRRYGALQDVVGCGLARVGWHAGELVEEAIPGFAIVVPAAEGFYALESGFTEVVLQGGVVRDLLHFLGEGVGVAVGDDEALFSVGKEVFGAGGGGGEDGTAAGHGLSLD